MKIVLAQAINCVDHLAAPDEATPEKAERSRWSRSRLGDPLEPLRAAAPQPQARAHQVSFLARRIRGGRARRCRGELDHFRPV